MIGIYIHIMERGIKGSPKILIFGVKLRGWV